MDIRATHALFAVMVLLGCNGAVPPVGPEGGLSFAGAGETPADRRRDAGAPSVVGLRELVERVDGIERVEPGERLDDVAASGDACNAQPPQPFLVRGHFSWKKDAMPEESAERKVRHAAAIRYRTLRYGHVEGFGDPAWNRHDPAHFARMTKFFGVGVQLNARVIPALRCVEAEIRRTCAEGSYVPRVLDGLRARNTYHNGEVSNHAYGIAIDIDPDKNSCCGCVPPLSEWPRCKEPVASPYERTALPRCWVDSFKKYGFYWLGDDPLEDTMHFEFLGDPEKVLRAPPAKTSAASPR
jgi:hypothetical protein